MPSDCCGARTVLGRPTASSDSGPRSPTPPAPSNRFTAAALRLPTALAAIVLAACATQNPEPESFASTHRHIQVLELPSSVGDRSLERVLHGKHEKVSAAILAADRRRINQALEAALRDATPCFAGLTTASLDIVPVDDPRLSTIGHAIDERTLASLQSAHTAEAYLRIRVTDYGETPRRWEGAYITFEVVSTVAIAGGLYLHRVTRPLAGAYLLEESIEEFGEGYAGFWALNRLSRPVRIEADLVDAQDGQVLWHNAHTGLAGWHWKNLRHMDDPTRDGLLDTSIDKAVREFSCHRLAGQP